MRIAVGVLIILALACGGWYGYRRWVAPPEVVTYREGDVQRGTIAATVSATGTVQPLLKVLVGSQVSGTITHWYADFNQGVHEGFVLAELDQDRFKAQVEQKTAAVAVSRARVEEAQAKVATATLDRERIESAFQRSAASEFEVDSTRAAETATLASQHAAEAQLQADEADLRMAKIELDKTIIRSPIDGVVISRDVDAGQTVAASLSAPTLFTIANDLSKMQVNAAVSETDIGKVREGMEAEFHVDAYPGRKFQGTVAQVRYAETVVDNVVTYTTLINVDNPDLLLRPGMTATILFQVAKAEDVLMVPNAALRFNPQAETAEINWNRPGKGQPVKPRVYRLQGGALAEVTVELGLNDGTNTEIRTAALRAGDKIVLEQQVRGRGLAAAGAAHAQDVMDAPLIDIRDAWKSYHLEEVEVPAVRGVSLVIPPGQFVAITGASGSGKSTFMHVVGCLDRLDRGTYAFEGRLVQELSRRQLAHLRNHRIGFVFQSFNLLARTSIVDNVAMPLAYQGLHRGQRRRRATEMLERLGLGDRLRHHPNQLSGGQQQRVALARALVTNPRIMLADEPTGNLDTTTSQEIMTLLQTLNREAGVSIVLVTHEQDIAVFAQRKVLFRDGRIVQDTDNPEPNRDRQGAEAA